MSDKGRSAGEKGDREVECGYECVGWGVSAKENHSVRSRSRVKVKFRRDGAKMRIVLVARTSLHKV